MRVDTLGFTKYLFRLGIAKVLTLTFLMTPLWSQGLDNLRCNDEQTTCFVNSRRLVIGDPVVIINAKKVIIAYGRVTDMRELSRKIEIEKRLATITADSRVLLNERDPNVIGGLASEDELSELRLVREEQMGVLFLLNKLNYAVDALGLTGAAFYKKRFREQFFLVGRGEMMYSSGSAPGSDLSPGYEDYTIIGLQGYGGVSWDILPHAKVRPMLDVSLGLGFISKQTSGFGKSSSLARIHGGMGVNARIGCTIEFEYKKYRPLIDFGVLRINNSTGFSFGAGFSIL